MSQAPAQREEPSMEDILSSIRKIIQSNDDGAEDVAAPAEVVSTPETPVVQSEVLEAVVPQDVTDAQTSTNSALISAGPKAKVAASFAQLNEAITASSSQSLEDMANDLLKPMLQEWLDNNLPGLVEKLVREEIERVARGGQES